MKDCEEEEKEECAGHGIQVLNWISLWLNWIQIQLKIDGMQIDVKKYKFCSSFSSFVTMVLTKKKIKIKIKIKIHLSIPLEQISNQNLFW